MSYWVGFWTGVAWALIAGMLVLLGKTMREFQRKLM